MDPKVLRLRSMWTLRASSIPISRCPKKTLHRSSSTSSSPISSFLRQPLVYHWVELAARFPRPDVRDAVRRIEALSAHRFGVHFTADSEFLELLERARALASHRFPSAGTAEVLKLGLKAFVRQAEEERFAVGRKPRRPVKAGKAEAPPPGGC